MLGLGEKLAVVGEVGLTEETVSDSGLARHESSNMSNDVRNRTAIDDIAA